jgi:hypothetical protein
VHVRAKRSAAGPTLFGWVRCGRLDADDWDPVDIPLGETEERYGYVIATMANQTMRQGFVNAPVFTYTDAERIADFGAVNLPLRFTVWQEGRLPGRALTTQIVVDG